MEAEKLNCEQVVLWRKPGARYAQRVTVFHPNTDTGRVTVIDQDGKFRTVPADNLSPVPKTKGKRVPAVTVTGSGD